MDKSKGMKFSTFHKNKINFLGDMSAWVKAMENIAGRGIQCWWQYNTVEKNVLEQNMVGQHYNFENKFKHTATGTSQQNFYAKLEFTVLAGILRLIINQMNIPRATYYKIVVKVLKTVTNID